jgi:hypothetical protein
MFRKAIMEPSRPVVVKITETWRSNGEPWWDVTQTTQRTQRSSLAKKNIPKRA